MPLEGLIPTHIDKYDKSNIIKAAMIYSEHWSGQKLDIGTIRNINLEEKVAQYSNHETRYGDRNIKTL